MAGSPFTDFMLPSDTGRGPSPLVWNQAPIAEALAGMGNRIIEQDDFTHFFTTGNKFNFVAGDSGAGCAPLNSAGELGGILRLTTGGTAQNEAYLGGGSGTGPACEIRSGSADIWFEGRVRPSSITGLSWAFGLGAPGIAAADALVDTTGAMVDKDFVGFRVKADDETYLDAVYNTISGGGETVHKNQAKLLVASTWYKLGIRYIDSQKKVFLYVDGAVVDPAGVAITATNMPDAKPLHMCLLEKTHAAASKTLDIDWYRLCVSFVG